MRRSWVLILAGLGALGIAVGVGVQAVRKDDGDKAMRRVQLAADPSTDQATLEAALPSEPVNVLLLGSDERSPDDAEAEQVTGRRSDTIAILRVDPRTDDLRVLSIPRDLWVEIADTGKDAKINSAFGGAGGGPDRLIRTIRAELGIQVHRYVEVDFEGFRAIVDLLGGVDVTFPSPVRDRASGFEIEDPGLVHLDANEALLYARSRNMEVFDGEQWQPDGEGDLGRIRRQQDLVRQLAARVRDTSGGSPGALDDLLEAMGPDLTIDEDFPVVELLSLIQHYIEVDPGTVDMHTVPARLGREGDQSVLHLDRAAAEPVLDAFRDAEP
jgi:LCP family protein required for cell wall assembly